VVVGAGYFQKFVVEPARYVQRTNQTLKQFDVYIDPAEMRLKSLKG